jgi:hypothetical protein
MTKQRKNTEIPDLAEIKRLADLRLAEIAHSNAKIELLEAEYRAAIQAVEREYYDKRAPINEMLKLSVSWLMTSMKSDKAVLFDGTDVVRLMNGSLIHSVADKVSIPRDALVRCKELGFDEVVKIAESLDRDAVEKWPDERLILIGAERKSKEEFSYDLKETKSCPA